MNAATVDRRQGQWPYAGVDRRAPPAFSLDYCAGFSAGVALAAEINDSHTSTDPAHVSRLIRALRPGAGR